MENNEENGSFWAGWWISVLFFPLGTILALIFGKSETKRGAGWGILWALIIYGILVGCTSML